MLLRKSINHRFICFMLLVTASLAPMIAGAQKDYTLDKVVYDISSANAQDLSHMLDRASLLQKLYQNDSFNASIVFVVHEGATPLFAKANAKYHELMQRAQPDTWQHYSIQVMSCFGKDAGL